jgi:xanthine/CO dehydrogenase XdhC/CoxF family maturation factor
VRRRLQAQVGGYRVNSGGGLRSLCLVHAAAGGWTYLGDAGSGLSASQAARWLAAGHQIRVVTVLTSGEQWAVSESDPALRCGRPRSLKAAEQAFVDRREPAPRLVVFGRGPDADAVAWLGGRLGFDIARSPRDVAPTALLLPRRPAAAVVMGHDFATDRAAVLAALAAGVPYVGVLGPRDRTARMLPPPWPAALHAPVGLDLGADGPEEIALAILGELLAVRRGTAAGFLRDRHGPIHPRAAAAEAEAAGD